MQKKTQKGLRSMAQMLKQVVDGFSYNTMLLWLWNRFFPNALAQLDVLRRAANYRTRWWVIPDDIDQPIQPYDTLYFQCEVSAGSYLWGYSFASISATDPSDTPVATTASDILLQAVDSCTGIPLFQDFANGGGCHSDFSARMLPILLSQPRLILEPGLVNVEMANRTPNTIFCQWLMHYAESCKLINEETRQRDWANYIATGSATNG
jgi:hypothetical protein